MRIVLQKVSEGSVDVVDETSGEVDTTFEPQHIGIGYVLLVGVEDTDGAKQIDWLAHKIEVKEGRFGSHMRVRLANDGPVTIILDTDELGV